ncbi:hypothetical protein M9Y10_045513 [Tritrichomonas musculus]|uniref:BEACH domain-containing protein n=1 Tax=Tritrichomonas musculus TaxID=1915356 RepID=A0ABR2JVG4_9EUKA
MNWIGKTLRSFNVSGSSAIRFLGDGAKNPEAKRFHEMVRDLDKKSGGNSIDQCIDYFIEHFGSYEISELDNLRLNRETTYLVLQFLPKFADVLNNHSNPNQKNTIDHGLLFLEKAIFIFIPEPKNVPELVQIIYQILNTNNEAILSRSMVFISKCLSIQILANLFYYQCDALTNLWLTSFVNNQVACQYYGPLFTATAEGIQFNTKNPDAYKQFFNQVNSSFREIKFVLSKPDSNKNKDEDSDEVKDTNITNIQNALNFVAVICTKVNSGNFFSEFFVVSKIYFYNLPSLSVFSTFLSCKTSDPNSPWEAINEICKSEFSSKEILESALEVIHAYLESPLISNFVFNTFIKRAKELSFESQQLLFDIVSRLPLSSKLDFFNFSTPPWDTGINSQLLCDNLVKKNIWGQYAIVMLSTLALKPEYNIFRDNLAKDKYISEIVIALIDMVSNEEEISTVLYNEFMKLAKEGLQAGAHVIEKIAYNQNVIIYLEQFLIALREKLVCDAVFDIYSKLARKNLFFVISFLENDGIPILFPMIESDSSLDFLAALSSNGPYDSIDNYISEHFNETNLSKLPQNKLMNLLMGMPQNSNSQGLLRIPSLLKFVNTEEISLSTQHDRFIFGTNAHKYGVDTRENLKKYSPTYMNPSNAKTLCNDPEMLLHITSPNYPHFSIFQCHKEAPHCTATLKLEVTTTFWIYVLSLSGKTVIMETPFGVISINHQDGKENSEKPKNNDNSNTTVLTDNLSNLKSIEISFFGLPPLKCDLKTWHMITLTATEWTFQQQQIVVYFNTTKIGEIDGAVGSTVTLGSENMNNAVYYLSSSFQTSDSAVTIVDVKQMYTSGPQVFCPTLIKMKPGFQFIPYKGIAKYFERLGGKEFIFIKMRKSNNFNDLIKLIQSSFNMLNLGLIKEKFFFYSLRYILYLKSDLISKNSKEEREKELLDSNDSLTKIWHPNFETIMYEILDFDIQKKWEYSSKIFCDFNLLSINDESFHFKILPEIFQHSIESNIESSSKLFHFLVDSYVIFNLIPEAEKNFLESINIYTKSNPNVLGLLLLTISAAAFIESNEGTMLSLVDDKMMKKQETLFQIVIDHMDLFTQSIKFEHALIYISTMRDELALDLLLMIAKITIINPTYFDIDVFKRYNPFLVVLSKYQKFWQTLLIFYTGQSADLIEDFADLGITRIEMTDLILDLLSHFIRFEISTRVENPYSFHVVKVVVKLLISSEVAFGDYIFQIQHLSSLGFDQETPTPMPFTFDPNNDFQTQATATSQQHQQQINNIQNENNSVPPKIIQKLTPSKCLFKGNEFNTLTRIQALDSSLYDETTLYLSKYNNSLSTMLNNIMNSVSSSDIDESMSAWKTLHYDRYPAPDNIDEYCKSEAVQIIANLVAIVFIQKANSSGISNKLLARLLINGCDVNQNVAQIMHRKIVYAIFAASKPLNEENYELFVKFVSNRVLEGWWWNDDLFLLFQASFIRKTKSTKQLVIACIFQSSNVESQIRIMKELCTTPEFIEYLQEPSLYCCYIQLLARYEIISNSLYPELRKELAEILISYINAKKSLNENNNENNNENENNEINNNENNDNSQSINNDPLNLLLQALINPANDYILEWFEKYRNEEPNQSLFVKFYNEMKKDAISSSKTFRDLRYDITVPPTYYSIMKYQATRLGSALYIRRAFRYQFFVRFNISNMEIESSVSSIFQKEVRLKFNENPSSKSMIVPAPQPFVVPQKFDPLCYDFPIPQAKFNSSKNKNNNDTVDLESIEKNVQPSGQKKDHCINGAFFPHSIHTRKYPTVLPELADVSQNAPKCYDGWKLPMFIESIPLDYQFSSFIGATSSLFDCSILMNPELLPGVAGFNNESFSIVLNAQLRNYTFLNNSKTTYEDSGFGFSLYSSTIPDLPMNFLSNLNSNSLSSSTITQMISSVVNNYTYRGNLFLRSTSEMLSHFAILENAAHGIYGPCKMFLHHPVISFKFNDVLIAIPRRFVYQNQEVDIYLVNGLHLTLIMKESDRKQLLLHIRQHQQSRTLSQIHLRSIQSSNSFLSPFGPYYAISLLAKSIEKVTKMWQSSEISTYDYLLYLNTAGGRSFNDLSQYPVFPWILGDFSSDKPILKRDLSKPMGTQTSAREVRFISTYNETEPHCHYRTHYSQPAAVLHYMLRVEPFTFYNLHLHSGLDHRDRQFSSVNDAWRSASEANLSDLKELIPEFYTMPMMFENPNNYDFQCRSDGTSLGTVVLPPWTNNSTSKFVWQMRNSLECPETSLKIGNWIDLIFGYKQRGQAAIDSINVFQPLAYDNAITTIINENSSKSNVSGGSGNDSSCANADITMNYALNTQPNASNFIENNISSDIASIDPSFSFTVDISSVKEYLSSIEQRRALTDAILQFGECPAQLFTTPHPECFRTPELRATIINTASMFTKLAPFGPNCTSIQFQKEKDFLIPHGLPKFEHYVGNGSLTLARVWDGYIEFGSASPIRIDSVDSCSSTCISSDRLILATASRNGVIVVYSCTNTKIDSNSNRLPLQTVNRLICPSYNIKTMAVTTQHAMLCAVSHKHIFLFDYTTGFLIKKLVIGSNFNNNKSSINEEEEDTGESFENQYENIISVIFDDISNFIVTISPSNITLYGLDLRLILRSEHNVDSGIPPFTCISISDFPFWSKMPLYVTGHKDGSVYAWMADVIEGGIFPLQIIDSKITNHFSITAVSLFMYDRCVLAIDEHGSSFLASVDPFKASQHVAQAQQQKEFLKEQLSSSSTLSSNSQIPLLANILPDTPSLPVSSTPLKHFTFSASNNNNNNDDDSIIESTKELFPSAKTASPVASSGFSPFSNSNNSSQQLMLSPLAFDFCRICCASIKGGIGSRCAFCGLCVCKQCIVSKRPMICSYCKSQFSGGNMTTSSGDSKEATSDEPSSTATAASSSSMPDADNSKAKSNKKGMFANAFSFMKDSKAKQQQKAEASQQQQQQQKQEALPSFLQLQQTSQQQQKQEALPTFPQQQQTSQQQQKQETLQLQQQQQQKQEVSQMQQQQQISSQQQPAFSPPLLQKEEGSSQQSSSSSQPSSSEQQKSSSNTQGNHADAYDDEFMPPFLNINQIRRFSMVKPSVHLNSPLSPPSQKKSVVNFDFVINSNSNDSSTEATHDEEHLSLVPLKEHHSQMMLTHTQMQMNMEQQENGDEDDDKKQRTNEDTPHFPKIPARGRSSNANEKNDDIGTVMLRYREEPKPKNIKRRYSFSTHRNNFS